MIISTMKVNADRLIDTPIYAYFTAIHFRKKKTNRKWNKKSTRYTKKTECFLFFVSTNYGYSIYLGIIENDFWINWYSLRHFFFLLFLFVNMWMCLVHSVTAPRNPHFFEVRRKSRQRMEMCKHFWLAKKQRKSEWFVCSKLSFISTLQFSIG